MNKTIETTHVKTIGSLLIKYKDQIQEILPNGMTVKKLSRVIISEINRNKDLASCDAASMMSAVMVCGRLGLEPGPVTDQVYLIPFYNSKARRKEVQVIVSYKGLTQLAYRSKQVLSIKANTICENDEFEHVEGLTPHIEHKPNFMDRGKILGSYAVANMANGTQHFEIIYPEDLKKIKKDSAVWKKWESEMTRKTAVRRLCKMLPLSPEDKAELQPALNLQAATEADEPQQNQTILLEAGIDVPKDVPKAVQEGIDKMKSKAVEMLSLAEGDGMNILKIFGKPAMEVISSIVTEQDALDTMETLAIANKKEKK